MLSLQRNKSFQEGHQYLPVFKPSYMTPEAIGAVLTHKANESVKRSSVVQENASSPIHFPETDKSQDRPIHSRELVTLNVYLKTKDRLRKSIR